MGIPIMPGPGYINACLACFDANQTPDAVIVSFSGILIGDGWNPTFPPAPNRTFILTHVAGCDYSGSITVNGTLIQCIWDADGGDLEVFANGFPIFSDSRDPCDTYFENDINNPIAAYYDGQAQIVCARSFSIISESQHIAELLNLQQDTDTVFDFWPVDADGYHIRFARPMSETNILIHFEH